MKKFFLFKKNKMIFIMILVTFSHIMFPLNFKYNTGENLVTKKREADEKERHLKSVLDAIRGHNNKYVQFFLATERNIANRKRVADEIVNREYMELI